MKDLKIWHRTKGGYVFCIITHVGWVSVVTELLDWTTRMDYWTLMVMPALYHDTYT